MIRHIISSELRRKLLTHYFNHPEEKYYVRELAVLLNLDPGNLSKELRIFEKERLFTAQKKGNLKFYHLNSEHPLYSELKQMIFKTEGIEGSLRAIVNQFPEIEAAFLYGSYAKGEERSGSDVDLMVVGKPDRRHLTAEVRKLEGKIGREINFNIYTKDEFDRKSKEKGSFLNQTVKGKKILIKGNLPWMN